MLIKGRVHCFFEQSGTFKKEFIKLGIPAKDYDIMNDFGETDHIVDLFKAIEDAYNGKASLFDSISKDDLVFAFFPCIYFCAPSQMNFTWGCRNYRLLSVKEKTDKILERNKKRAYYYEVAIKMFAVCKEKDIRLIMENPWSENTYLKGNFILPPTVIDMNRMMRGDYRVKPTAYWFVGCEPTHGKSIQFDKIKEKKKIMSSRKSNIPGVCSKERSMISPDYARNFICDYIIGRPQHHSETSIF